MNAIVNSPPTTINITPYPEIRNVGN